MYKKTQFFIMLVASVSYQILLQADQPNFHQQLNAVLLKNVKVENPSEKEQTLINVAKAFHDFGTPLKLSQPENWHALQSVDFFSILEKHNHTQTAFGSRILQQQCSAHMTDDIAILKSRQERIKFLHQNPELMEKLSKILDRSIDAEQIFLNLFKEVDQSARNLYFSSWFSKFNENSAAMDASTRFESTLPMALCVVMFLEFPILDHYFQDSTNSNCISKLGKAACKALVSIPESQKKLIKVSAEGLGSYTAAVTLTIAFDTFVAYFAYRIAQDTKNCSISSIKNNRI